MSPDSKFDLGDYVQVKDRIAKFYELFGQGRLVTLEVTATREPDDVPRVWVKAAAYRSPDDALPGIGWSWLELPGKSPYTKGSELENAETSAWGRAIGSLGILIDGSIASANEVASKTAAVPQQDGDFAEPAPPSKERPVETEELLGRLSKTGTVKKGTATHYDLEYRQTPDGHMLGFRLELDGERAIPQVLCEGDVGEALYVAGANLLGQRVTVKGRLFNVKAPGRASYYRLRVQEIQTPDLSYPAPDVAVGQEPLFSAEEEAAIGAAVEKAGVA